MPSLAVPDPVLSSLPLVESWPGLLEDISAICAAQAERPLFCTSHQHGNERFFYGVRWCERCQRVKRCRMWRRLYKHLEAILAGGRKLWHVVVTKWDLHRPVLQEVKAVIKLTADAMTDGKPEVKGGCWFLDLKYNIRAHTHHPHTHVIVEADELPKSITDFFWYKEVDSFDYANVLAWYVTKPAILGVAGLPDVEAGFLRATKRMPMHRPFGSWWGIGLFSQKRKRREREAAPETEAPLPEQTPEEVARAEAEADAIMGQPFVAEEPVWGGNPVLADTPVPPLLEPLVPSSRPEGAAPGVKGQYAPSRPPWLGQEWGWKDTGECNVSCLDDT